MFAYNAGGVTDRSGEIIAQGANNAAMLQMEAMNQLGQNIAAIGAMYGDYREKRRDKKSTLEGMDQTVAAMAEIGVLPQGFVNKYSEADDETRPFVYQALASPMFNSHLSGVRAEQAAMAQQRVWGGGGGGGGGGAAPSGPSANNKQGYVFKG